MRAESEFTQALYDHYGKVMEQLDGEVDTLEKAINGEKTRDPRIINNHIELLGKTLDNIHRHVARKIPTGEESNDTSECIWVEIGEMKLLE